jgi:hypothetical protein
MRGWVVRGLHGAAVVLLFGLVLEGPDLLLLAVRDVRRWLPIGLATGLLTLPLLPCRGLGFAPPWTMPAYVPGTSLRRAGVYHLVCSVAAAWLWTYPTLVLVAWVHERRGFAVETVGAVPADAVSVAGGLVLSGLLFFPPALVVFVRLSTFRTDVDLHAARAVELFRPGVVAVGSPLLVGVVVGVLPVVLAG